MSERQEKKARYNLRLQFITDFYSWLAMEPPIWRFISWRKWRAARPRLGDLPEIPECWK